MSIEDFWNNTVWLHRELAAVDARDTYGHAPATVYPVGAAPSGHNAMPDQSWGGSTADRGPGEQEGSVRRWYLDAALDVRSRDVLVVTAGNESGTSWRVEGIPTKVGSPQGVHHIEANASIFTGTVAEESS